jgi:Mn2+/Fe2+ NRAMP family transporter
VPILAGSASYAVSESFGWPAGIDRPWYRAKQFYAVIIAACLIGMSINFLHINPIGALFYTAVINGLIAPPLMVLIMLVSNDTRIMGTHAPGRLTNLLGWVATAVMGIAAIVLLVTL